VICAVFLYIRYDTELSNNALSIVYCRVMNYTALQWCG